MECEALAIETNLQDRFDLVEKRLQGLLDLIRTTPLFTHFFESKNTQPGRGGGNQKPRDESYGNGEPGEPYDRRGTDAPGHTQTPKSKPK